MACAATLAAGRRWRSRRRTRPGSPRGSVGSTAAAAGAASTAGAAGWLGIQWDASAHFRWCCRPRQHRRMAAQDLRCQRHRRASDAPAQGSAGVSWETCAVVAAAPWSCRFWLGRKWRGPRLGHCRCWSARSASSAHRISSSTGPRWASSARIAGAISARGSSTTAEESGTTALGAPKFDVLVTPGVTRSGSYLQPPL